MNTLFTIVIPTYNRRKLIERTVQSVLKQSYPNWQLIIIDDGSTDDTWQYLEKIKEPRIETYNQDNNGRSAARNKGINLAKGDHLCFVDSDDVLEENYLSNFKRNISNNKSIIAAGVGLKNANNKVVSESIPSSEKKQLVHQLLHGHFNLMPFCFPTNLLKNHSFDPSLYYGEDFHFMLPLILENSVKTTNTITSHIYIHENRTLHSIYKNPIEGYQQQEYSVIETIISNKEKIQQWITEQEIVKIIQTKRNTFIKNTARSNFNDAIYLMGLKIKVTPAIYISLLKERIIGWLKDLKK